MSATCLCFVPHCGGAGHGASTKRCCDCQRLNPPAATEVESVRDEALRLAAAGLLDVTRCNRGECSKTPERLARFDSTDGQQFIRVFCAECYEYVLAELAKSMPINYLIESGTRQA